MKIVVRALAFALGAAIALPAFADDAAVVATAQLDPVLDVAVVEQAAASAAAETNVLGLSPSVTTGLIFFVVAVTLFTVGTDGNPAN